jgi:hypothetical protein
LSPEENEAVNTGAGYGLTAEPLDYFIARDGEWWLNQASATG